MYIPLLEVETPLFNFTPLVRAAPPVLFYLFIFLRITVDTVEEYIIFL